MSYQKLSIEERITIQIGQLQGLRQRATARMLDRSPSTVSRELRRNAAPATSYSANQAHQKMRQRRTVCRPALKLYPGSDLFELVVVAILYGDRFIRPAW